MRQLITTHIQPIVLTLVALAATLLGQSAWGQDAPGPRFVEITIDHVPRTTPENARLYLVGSFNDWQPGQEKYAFGRDPAGRYVLKLDSMPEFFEYKFTRGTWESVESTANGRVRANRVYRYSETLSPFIHAEILNWEDLAVINAITVVVKGVPDNTPADANLYIAGNLNAWDPGNEEYRLLKDEEGQYSFTFFTEQDTLQYKITRGSWETVEGRANGMARGNRMFVRQGNGGATIEVDVESWEDLSGHALTGYGFWLLFGAVQCVLLIIGINGLPISNRSANMILSVLLGITGIALALRVGANYRWIFNPYPKLILVYDFILFLYAPLFYLYLRRLLLTQGSRTPRIWLHFVPVGVHLLAYFPLLVMGRQNFIDGIVGLNFQWIFMALGAVALAYNTWYAWRVRRLLLDYRAQSDNQQSFDYNTRYLNVVMAFQMLALGMWLITYLVGGIGMLAGYEATWLTERGVDVVWVLFATTPSLIGFFALAQPEMYRVHEPEAQSAEPAVTAGQEDENAMLELMKYRLAELMQKQQPYKNPKLALAELAEMMEATPQELSRVINEGYQKNFFDFVNHYRVEEFKKLAQQEDYKRFTLLAIAYEVGFNSKTSFNRSFKKLTNQTPSEYFREIQNG